MLNQVSVLLIFAIPDLLHAQVPTPAEHAVWIEFSIANLGIEVEGNFSGIESKILFSSDMPESASFEIHIPTKTIDTGITLRDKHLKNETYFSCDQYPFIRFISKQVRQQNDGSFEVTGLLSIKNTTKQITFPFQVSRDKEKFLLTGKLTIDRRDFKVGKNSFTMSDYVNVKVTVIAQANSF